MDATLADFSAASLVGAVLCSMRASDTTWRGCNFEEAHMGHSVLDGATFCGQFLRSVGACWRAR